MIDFCLKVIDNNTTDNAEVKIKISILKLIGLLWNVNHNKTNKNIQDKLIPFINRIQNRYFPSKSVELV